MATEYGQYPVNNVLVKQRIREEAVCETANIPEIHSFISVIHEELAELGDVICSLDNRLSCISVAPSPTADAQPLCRPSESPMGNELSNISLRIKSLINNVRDIRNRICV